MGESFQDFTLATDFEEFSAQLERVMARKQEGLLYFRGTPFRISHHKSHRAMFEEVDGLYDQIGHREYMLFETILPGYKDAMVVKSAVILAMKDIPVVVQVQSEWKQLYICYYRDGQQIAQFQSVHVPFIPQHLSQFQQLKKLVKVPYDRMDVVKRESYKLAGEELDRVRVCQSDGCFVALTQEIMDTEIDIVDQRLEDLVGSKQRMQLPLVIQDVFEQPDDLISDYVDRILDGGHSISQLTYQAWNMLMEIIDREYWQLQLEIPGVAGTVDNHQPLIFQKLQMINHCIRHLNGVEEDQTSDELYGIEKQHESLKLLGFDMPLQVPLTQNTGPKTSDMINEHVELLQSLGTSDDAAQFRAKLQSQSLLGDMQAFKFANPSASMVDFIRWHSPRDYDEQTGKLSTRMDEGYLWQQLWNEAVPTHYKDQDQHFDAVLEGQKALDYLQNINQQELRRNLMPYVVGYIGRQIGCDVKLKSCAYPYEEDQEQALKDVVLKLENFQDNANLSRSLSEIFGHAIAIELIRDNWVKLESLKGLNLQKFNTEYIITAYSQNLQVARMYCESRDGCFRIVTN